MTNAIGSAQDPALQPAAAAAKSIDAGVEATRKALDSHAGEGRLAVQLIEEAVKAASTPEEPGPRGQLIDKRA
ncbi:MAG TPA: hypothetical protein VFD84_04030 [Candidatus Binatia bacterium]|nr:hypothetical protein [Candidatus Binatia bacterium]